MHDLESRLYQEVSEIALIDCHSHIDPSRPTARDLDDLLGHRYYTELAHSSGMDKAPLRSEVPAEERVRAIVRYLPAIENTVQYQWLRDIARDLFGFPHDTIDESNCDELVRTANRVLSQPDWENELVSRARIDKVFLTNHFDDPLSGFNQERYVPGLDTDELVFQLHDPAVVERLRHVTGVDVGNVSSLRAALGVVTERFHDAGARTCVTSLPPRCVPQACSDASVDLALRQLVSGAETSEDERARVAQFVFWTLVEFASEFHLPFQLMIGAERDVYRGGVHQARDLPNRVTSLRQLADLFNAFPGVSFLVSVLDSSQNPELVAYSWIFPNVMTHGHWWYANVPAMIEHAARERLQALPRTQQIGYYSDMWKLEFGPPKYDMYRRCLSRVLVKDFVLERGWSEEKAVGLARDLLRGNAERVFLAEPALTP